MSISIREAENRDINIFIDFSVKLSNFNRQNHDNTCKYDDYETVISRIKSKSITIFENRNSDILILIAELKNEPVGYVLARIYEEDKTADNGTGRIGLLDELFIDESARGLRIGQDLINQVIAWFKVKGINRIKLHAFSWNEVAKRVYEKNGFREYAVSYELYV